MGFFAEDAVPRLLGGLPQQLSMPATEMFHAADAAESRLAAARSMLSKKLSFRLAARPVAASATATAVGSAATISRGRSKDSLLSEEQPPARRRSVTGLDSWKDGTDASGFSAEERHPSSGMKEDDGSEWDVLSASLDESGGGQDFEAGLGVQPHLGSTQDPPSGRAGRRSPNFRNRTNDHDRSLTPIWPLSLYPLSYREDISVEQPLGRDDGLNSSRHVDQMQPSTASPPSAVASVQDTAATVADMSRALEPLCVRESVELSEDEDEHAAQLGMQATFVRLDSEAAHQEGGNSVASTSILAGQAVTSDRAQTVSSAAVGQTANNAVPAQPISRLTAVRQTAARAGRVVLGASAFGARVCFPSSHSSSAPQ